MHFLCSVLCNSQFFNRLISPFKGYVTELILTLEAVVDALDSDIRPIDLTKEIFKSTPNLKDMVNQGTLGSIGSGGNKSVVCYSSRVKLPNILPLNH